MKQSEGSDTTPHPKHPCFAVCALVCDPLSRAECVPAFARESKCGAFVRGVEKRDEKQFGDKIYGSSFAGLFSSAGVEGSQRTGKCMYIKARWNQGLQMRRSEQFCWQRKSRCARRREGPCFGGVPIFTRESEREPFVREVEKRNEKRFETSLWR